jgi:UDP-N-acetylglucosamine--N-acetylmuramyl-(pentapeptide) pyrophosphoryl-undecaprenol N-acetylglucosamine transferase
VNARTLMVMAGGTGGHVFPALAVADALAGSGWRIVWLATRAGMESRIVPPRGYAMEWITVRGVRGKGWLRAALAPLELARACLQSLAAMLRVRPDVVLGMGGYVSLPGGLTAWLLRLPLVIHEQNSIAGLANRLLGRFATRVLTGFPGAFEARTANRLGRLLPRPVGAAWCGNPVRAEIAALEAPGIRYGRRTGPLRLLVVGGSQGAEALNRAVPLALAQLPAERRPVVVHQSGARGAEALAEAYRRVGVEAATPAFIDDMAREYAASDLVVCRSGALTVAELTAAGVASVLVPFPAAVDDHQTGNARFLADAGAARLIAQRDLTPERLAQELASFDREALARMAGAAFGLRKPEATRMVAEVCRELAT